MWHTVWLSLLISLLINGGLFLVAFGRRSDKLTDLSYALSFIVVTLFAAWDSQNKNLYALVMVLMVCLWALRLGGFLLIRIFKSGRDKRFDGVRDNFFKFGRFWLGQALTVWLLLLPVELSVGRSVGFGWLPLSGVLIWGLGLIIETVADYQKYRFKAVATNKDKWIESGLWGYSRHPNYFGEILIWTAIFIYSVDALTPLQRWPALISPVLIIILLRYVSGVPPLEKVAEQRWGSNINYQRYKAQTNLLIPSYKRRRAHASHQS